MEESEYFSEGGGKVGVKGTGEGRIEQGEDNHGVDGGDLYGSSSGAGRGEGGVEVLHGREGVGVEGGVAGVKGLVANGDGVDGEGGDEREDIGADPAGGGIGFGGEGGDVTISSAKDEGYIGASEGPDDVRVGAVHLGLFDGAWPSPMPYQPALSALSPSLPQRLPSPLHPPTDRHHRPSPTHPPLPPSSPSPSNSSHPLWLHLLALIPSSAASPIILVKARVHML